MAGLSKTAEIIAPIPATTAQKSRTRPSASRTLTRKPPYFTLIPLPALYKELKTCGRCISLAARRPTIRPQNCSLGRSRPICRPPSSTPAPLPATRIHSNRPARAGSSAKSRSKRFISAAEICPSQSSPVILATSINFCCVCDRSWPGLPCQRPPDAFHQRQANAVQRLVNSLERPPRALGDALRGGLRLVAEPDEVLVLLRQLFQALFQRLQPRSGIARGDGFGGQLLDYRVAEAESRSSDSLAVTKNVVFQRSERPRREIRARWNSPPCRQTKRFTSCSTSSASARWGTRLRI